MSTANLERAFWRMSVEGKSVAGKVAGELQAQRMPGALVATDSVMICIMSRK